MDGAARRARAMASSDIGAWVPSATTAVQVLGPSADPFLDGLQEKRQRAVPGSVGDDHAQRAAGQVQCGDLRPHERAHLRGVEDVPGPPERHRHRSASRSDQPLLRQPLQHAARPPRRTHVSPSATRLSCLRGRRRRAAADRRSRRQRIVQEGKRARRARRPRPAAASQMAATRANVDVVSSDRASRAATTGSSRWGNLLDPSAPTCAQVWPSAGLANRRSASSAKAAGCSAAGNAATSSVSLDDVPHEPGDEGIRRRRRQSWRDPPAGRRRPRRSVGR